MTKTKRTVALAMAIVGVAFIGGCAQPEVSDGSESSMTWEEAKAATQARELEIAALIPAGQVAILDQNDTGTLFSCDETQHRWHGLTTVVLVAGADVEAVVKSIEPELGPLFLEEDDFDVTNRRGAGDVYLIKVKSSASGESYIVGEGLPGTIAIDSWSGCFTLPEGTYPGGEF